MQSKMSTLGKLFWGIASNKAKFADLPWDFAQLAQDDKLTAL